MEFGLQVRGDYETLVSAASWAETRGLAAIATPDHYLQRGGRDQPGWDHLVHLSALARDTSRIELVSLVSPVGFRHPAIYYKMAVTIDEVSGGRFTLGLGTGWMAEEFEAFGIPYPDLAMRYEMTEEALQYLRAALSGGGQGHAGKFWELAAFDPKPTPGNLRLIVGGSGPRKTPRLAGLYADEFNIYGCDPAGYERRVATARDWAASSARDAGSLTFSATGPAVAARSKDEYQRILGSIAAMTGHTPQRIEEVYTEREIPHGHGSQASEMAARLEEAGCNRYYLQAFAIGPEDYDLIYDAFRF